MTERRKYWSRVKLSNFEKYERSTPFCWSCELLSLVYS